MLVFFSFFSSLNFLVTSSLERAGEGGVYFYLSLSLCSLSVSLLCLSLCSLSVSLLSVCLSALCLSALCLFFCSLCSLSVSLLSACLSALCSLLSALSLSETYNCAYNILELVDILRNVSFTASETERDYY